MPVKSIINKMITYCEKTKKRLRNFVPVTSSAFYVSEIAMRSILLELSATPKPGLVDRFNSGSHSDMSYETFILSTSAIIPYFSYMAQAGIEYGTSSEPLCNLLPVIRTIGLAAEQRMFSVTGGINTQKGIIFLIGLTCGACGYLLSAKEKITPANLSTVISEISKDIIQNELSDLENKRNLTSGEKIFLQYKIQLQSRISAGHGKKPARLADFIKTVIKSDICGIAFVIQSAPSSIESQLSTFSHHP